MKLTAESRRRLTILRDALLEWSSDKFNMDFWAAREGRPLYSLPDKEECGTTCCALGLSALLPEFQRLGLRWSCAAPAFTDGLSTSIGFHAGAAFFGIDLSDSEYLFSPDSYDETDYECGPRPADVANRIDDMLRLGVSEDE